VIAEPSSDGATHISVRSDGEFLVNVFRNGKEATFRVVEGQNDLML